MGLLGITLSVVLSQREVASAGESPAEVVPIPAVGQALLEGREASADAIREFFKVEEMEAFVKRYSAVEV